MTHLHLRAVQVSCSPYGSLNQCIDGRILVSIVVCTASRALPPPLGGAILSPAGASLPFLPRMLSKSYWMDTIPSETLARRGIPVAFVSQQAHKPSPVCIRDLLGISGSLPSPVKRWRDDTFWERFRWGMGKGQFGVGSCWNPERGSV
jgi:hypothetical protein